MRTPHSAGLPRCYVASPLGFTEAGRSYYASTYLPALATVTQPIDPWSWLTPQEIQAAIDKGAERELWLSIGARNADAIRSSALLAAFLEGQEVDSGTAAEVGFAVGVGARCFGLRSDLRQAGEATMALNLQVETLILQSGGAIVSTLDELVDALAAERVWAAKRECQLPLAHHD